MSLPVLIPAHNEAENLPAVLNRLSKGSDSIEPILLANGCEDDTAQIGESFGVTTLNLEAAGKMPALQEGMRYLGDRALDGFVILDADSMPVVPRMWAETYGRKLGGPACKVVCGLSVYGREQGIVAAGVRSVRAAHRQIREYREGVPTVVAGRNMGLKLSEEALDYTLAMPNVWPSEDMMMKEIATEVHGGDFLMSMDPRIAVFTSARGHISLRERIQMGYDASMQRMTDRYDTIGPGDAIHYRDIRDEVLSGQYDGYTGPDSISE